MKILHVDDEAGILEQSKDFLEKQDNQIEVDSTTSPEKGLEKAKKENYDAILSDYKMPEMDGLEFLKKIRNEEIEVPFIILTGKGNEEVAMKALNLGADHYKQKTDETKNLKSQYSEIADLIKQEVETKEKKEKIQLEGKVSEKFIEVSEAILIAIDKNKKVTLFNRKASEVLGYSKEEAIGKNWFESFIPERKREAVEKTFQKLIEKETDEFEYFENPVIAKNGKEKIIFWHNTILQNEDDKPIGTLSSGVDITERRKRKSRKFRHDIAMRTGENITSDIVREFEVNVTPEGLGLLHTLEHLAELSSNPPPENLFKLMTIGTKKALKGKEVDADKEKIRKIISPHLLKFLREIRSGTDKAIAEVPEEYKELEESLGQE